MSETAPTPASKIAVGSQVRYRGQHTATVVAIHNDDPAGPYYTIQMSSGNLREVEGPLTPLTVPNPSGTESGKKLSRAQQQLNVANTAVRKIMDSDPDDYMEILHYHGRQPFYKDKIQVMYDLYRNIINRSRLAQKDAALQRLQHARDLALSRMPQSPSSSLKIGRVTSSPK